MKLAPLLLLAACSSPAATTTTTPPGDDVYVSIDAAPPAIVEAPIDAAPPEPELCIPPTATLEAVVAGAPVLCDDAYDFEPRCFRVEPGGGLAVADPVEVYPAVLASCDSEMGCTEVLWCDGVDACEPLPPKPGTGEELVGAALDPSRARVVVGFDGPKAGALELWDVGSGKLLARAAIKHAADATIADVQWFGDAILVAIEDAKGIATATLWKLAGKKLKAGKVLPGDYDGTAIVGPDHAAVVIGQEVTIYDVKSIKALGSASWAGLVDGGPPEGAWLELAGADDVVAVFVNPSDEAEDLLPLALGVLTPLTGGAQRVAYNLCPSED